MKYLSKFKKYHEIFVKSREQGGENIPLAGLFFKILHWIMVRHGNVFEFFMMGLHKKGGKPDDYLSENEFLTVHNKLNPQYYLSVLEDKYVFDRFLKGFGFPMAELIGLLENGKMTWIPGRENEPIENLLHHNLDCFCKLITGWGGSKVNHLVIKDGTLKINNKNSTIAVLRSLTNEGIFVLQKSIQQHPEMNRLNSSCVNTIRIITIHDGTTIHKHGSFIRIGIGDSHVDNVSAGNIACGIREDGSLFDEACDGFMMKVGLTHHPDTNVSFGSFKIPFYREAVDLTINMHKAFHCFFIIGWDIAVTASGPFVIEGNPVSSLSLEQVFTGGVRKEFYKTAKAYQKNRKLNL
jgi:hypothetical protein